MRWIFLAILSVLYFCQASIAQSSEQELERELNEVDRPSAWRNAQIPAPRPPAYTPATWQRTPVNQASATAAMPPISTQLQNFLPRSVYASGPQNNPFNLSPFGMLHYMWDDTRYVSSTNPIDQCEVRNNYQIAQQQAQLAQVAAQRAKYSSDPSERQNAAAAAQQYAAAARAATQRAYADSSEGSLDAPSWASMVRDAANQAQNAANRASAAATSYRW